MVNGDTGGRRTTVRQRQSERHSDDADQMKSSHKGRSRTTRTRNTRLMASSSHYVRYIFSGIFRRHFGLHI